MTTMLKEFKEMLNWVEPEDLLSEAGLQFFLDRTDLAPQEFIRRAREIVKNEDCGEPLIPIEGAE